MVEPSEAHEQHEHLEHTAHGGGHGSGNKRIAILIAVLAALLAIVESGGKAAQTEQLVKNLDASDTYAFFQAKTIRKALMLNAAELAEALAPPAGQPAAGDSRLATQVATWKREAARLDSDPEKGEGRKELLEKAKHLTTERDEAALQLHNFEYGSAALQLAIVLASASVITGMPVLTLGAVGLGALGTTLGGLGWFAPHLLHDLTSGGGGHGGH